MGESRPRPQAYYLQNRAIFKAAAELEAKGVLPAGGSLDAVRRLAGEINPGVESISRLSLKQREILIDKLRELGATARNPHVYASDLAVDAARSGEKGRRVIPFPSPKEAQLRMLDALAARIRWKEENGYRRFCEKQIGAPRPRNNREVTRLRLAMESMIDQEKKESVQNGDS